MVLVPRQIAPMGRMDVRDGCNFEMFEFARSTTMARYISELPPDTVIVTRSAMLLVSFSHSTHMDNITHCLNGTFSPAFRN